MVLRPSPAVYLAKELSDSLDALDPKLRKWLSDMETVLKGNKLAGDPVPKIQIPRYYREKFGVNNLYRYDHPEGYRSCYTLLTYDVGVCPLILDLRSHREYSRIFGYKSK
jgi:mRNA-degrading endonuclease RelE of RelBE toxin-antitoxin system